MKNKIGWCNTTWNPVWGCLNHCEYCYARGIAKRFGGVKAEQEYYSHYWGNKRCAKGTNKAYIERLGNDLRKFIPTFLYGQYFKRFPEKPQRIFVGSMSEIAHWNEEWMKKVLYRIAQYPQHIFQFLTKFPGVYLLYKFPVNCWLGITITDTKNYDYLEYEKFKISNPNNLKFISFEPLLNEISINLENIDWVILGAETGNRKDRVFAKRCWIESILINCYEKGIPVYIKDSIIKWQPQLKKFKGFPKNKTINKL